MSNKTEHHVQCILEKGNTHTVAWIEEKYAVVNKHVKMEKKDANGNEFWEEGWIVTQCGAKMESSHVKNFAHNAGKDIWSATSGSCPRGNK